MQTLVGNLQGGSFATARTEGLYYGCPVITRVHVAHNTGAEPVALRVLVDELNRDFGLGELARVTGRANDAMAKLGEDLRVAPGETHIFVDALPYLPVITTRWEAGKASIEMFSAVEEPPKRVTVRVTASARTEDLRLVPNALFNELITTFNLSFDEALGALRNPDALRSRPGAKGSPFHEAELAVGHGRTATVAVYPA